MKIEKIQIETSATGRNTPPFGPIEYINTIMFSSEEPFSPQDLKMLTDMLELYYDVDKNLSNNKPATSFNQIK